MGTGSRGHDILGDVHGKLDKLRGMVDRLGYRESESGWHHPKGRHLISLGDLIDDGPRPLECLELIAAMARDGCATMVLGNHELNGVLYMRGLREHSEKNREQFRATLRQIEAAPDRWEPLEQFICDSPTRLEVHGTRVIHACWHEPSIGHLPETLGHWLANPTDAGMDTLEKCIKGPEEDGEPRKDRSGHVRTKHRVHWWKTYPESAASIAFGHYALGRDGGAPVNRDELWLGPGRNAACLDYGAARDGPLVALRLPEAEFVLEPEESSKS